WRTLYAVSRVETTTRPASSTAVSTGDIWVVPSARVVAMTARWCDRMNSTARAASMARTVPAVPRAGRRAGPSQRAPPGPASAASAEVAEDEAGLRLGVEERGLRGHPLAAVRGRLDLGHRRRPQEHARLGRPLGDRPPHVVDPVLVGQLVGGKPGERPVQADGVEVASGERLGTGA